MSYSSSFIILREDLQNKEYMENIKDAYEYSNWDKQSLFGKVPEKNDIPMYIPAKRLKYVNHFSKQLFDEIFNVQLNSSFSVLIHEFNMSPYNKTNTKEIPLTLAEEMLEAINYLLLQNYNRSMEDEVLQNDYIKLFGETYAPYYNFYHKEKLQFNDDYTEQKFILYRLKHLFDIFVQASIEDKYDNIKYILLYTVC